VREHAWWCRVSSGANGSAVLEIRALAKRYPGGVDALRGVGLMVEEGELLAVVGPSGSGKSTLLRALAGLVPHFHGGTFSGRVEVAGLDTRLTPPSRLAGVVATLFQDPEDQVVMARVEHEVAFGLENVGVPPLQIRPRALDALRGAGAARLASRPTYELSSGELQRVCFASALALRPRLLLLDEPTSQVDSEGAAALVGCALEAGAAVVVTEHRPERVLDVVERVLFVEDGRVLFDGDAQRARDWLARERPAWVGEAAQPPETRVGDVVVSLEQASFAYGERMVVDRASLELRRGEIVALTGRNGSGKTTLAKLAASLLEPAAGAVRRAGRAAYLSQDPGRYLTRDRADEEVALGIGGDLHRARRWLGAVGLAGLAHRHPRDLSSGERERLALAAVLAVEPDLLVLDEPTRGVDPNRKAELAELLRAAAPARATLVVTHDEPFAASVAHRTVGMGEASRGPYASNRLLLASGSAGSLDEH
jgi:energy-coupling factor transport system ATP-binding protein